MQSQVNAGSKFTLKLPIQSPFSIDPRATTTDLAVMPADEE